MFMTPFQSMLKLNSRKIKSLTNKVLSENFFLYFVSGCIFHIYVFIWIIYSKKNMNNYNQENLSKDLALIFALNITTINIIFIISRKLQIFLVYLYYIYIIMIIKYSIYSLWTGGKIVLPRLVITPLYWLVPRE